MIKTNILQKKKMLLISITIIVIIVLLLIRVIYIQAFSSEKLQKLAYEQQTRDRLIKAVRGDIVDRNGEILATSETAYSISVINAQITDIEHLSKSLAEILELEYDFVKEKASEKVALVRIKTKVDKEIADEVRNLNIDGVVIDEDVKRVYPNGEMAAQVIGFVGKDNQGIIGLEAKYEDYLKGDIGKILTETDGRGNKMPNGTEYRVEPTKGNTLVTSIDKTLQEFCEQTLDVTLEQTKAKRAAIVLMNPKNGEIYAMANKPSFDPNTPFIPIDEEVLFTWDSLDNKEQSDYLNKMWRNFTINDTYEPGSTFKIVTSVAGLSEGVVDNESEFDCNGYHMVGKRMIKCWRYPNVHGHETFVDGVKNSCNPVFMIIAERLGVDNFYKYIINLGFSEKTGIDLPGEAVGILHNPKKMGELELATTSFGQSIQVTPIQMLKAGSIIVNGGHDITPHVAIKALDENNEPVFDTTLDNEELKQIITEEVSKNMRETLEQVVYDGTGNKTYIPGYRVGGKTATSEKLPRGQGKYIASFMAFAPADDPEVIALVLIDEPVGAYYGGQVAGPIMQTVLGNVLPRLNVTPNYNEEELLLDEVKTVIVPDVVGLSIKEAKKACLEIGIVIETDIEDTEKIIEGQFPKSGETINLGSKIIIY